MDEFEAYECYRRGTRLLASGDAHAASVALERAKRLEPDSTSIRETLGRAYLTMRRDRSAADEFAAIVAVHPTDHYAHYGLGRALDRLGDRSAAFRHYRLAEMFGSKLVR